MTQLIPARGRKLTLGSGKAYMAVDTTYPREGTETDCEYSFAAFHYWTQLIPARGRKLDAKSAEDFFNRHNLSPRGDGNLA